MLDGNPQDVRGSEQQASDGVLLRHYRALEAASCAMLAAAEAGDWRRVHQVQGEYAVVLARLKRLKQLRPIDPHHQPERLRIVRSIVANDAQIRRLAQALPACCNKTQPLD